MLPARAHAGTPQHGPIGAGTKGRWPGNVGRVCTSFTICIAEIESAENKETAAMILLRANVWRNSLALLSCCCGRSALACGPAAQTADDLIVKYDQSQLLRLPRPAAEIIIGNPAIADIAVQTGNLLVVTGKTFGITNIIALDAERNVIQDQRVLVKRDEAKVVNLQRGTAAAVLQLHAAVQSLDRIGDEQDYFDTIRRPRRRRSASPSAPPTAVPRPQVSKGLL